MKQSTHHILMVEPVEFYPNPQTTDTNAYQADYEDISRDEIYALALDEFNDYRAMLEDHGIKVTTVQGRIGSPDMVFPNWASTYDNGLVIIYPMHNENRRHERTPQVMSLLKSLYPKVEDWSGYEEQGLALESTASIVADHVNRRAYAGLSKRTSKELAEKWAKFMGYDLITFETRSHTGIPVYHTDYLMYIGTKMAGICAECITDTAVRTRVLHRLYETHDVVEFTMDQLRSNCCNALELVGRGGEKILTMSASAKAVLSEDQLAIINKHYQILLCPDIKTLEKYGGGSARCMIMELF